jgi:hypothetical protein
VLSEPRTARASGPAFEEHSTNEPSRLLGHSHIIVRKVSTPIGDMSWSTSIPAITHQVSTFTKIVTVPAILRMARKNLEPNYLLE